MPAPSSPSVARTRPSLIVLTRSVARRAPAPLRAVLSRLYQRAALLRFGGDVRRAKEHGELLYWASVLRGDATERRAKDDAHYRYVFTTLLGLTEADYAGRRVLDVGCGPRGSLEWATMAAERVGLDPLADAYRQFGTDQHQMRYVPAGVEAMPFPDGYFDIVTALNSLDHVDDLEASIRELVRVTAPGGRLCVITEVNHAPTLTEPVSFGWDVLKRFVPSCRVEYERRCEKPGRMIYQGLDQAPTFDDQNPAPRSGILLARLVKAPG